jgi:hypothetical protein
VVDASIGAERGWRDFCREDNAGQSHTKITIYRRLPVAPGHRAVTLSQIVSHAPKDETD